MIDLSKLRFPHGWRFADSQRALKGNLFLDAGGSWRGPILEEHIEAINGSDWSIVFAERDTSIIVANNCEIFLPETDIMPFVCDTQEEAMIIASQLAVAYPNQLILSKSFSTTDILSLKLEQHILDSNYEIKEEAN